MRAVAVLAEVAYPLPAEEISNEPAFVLQLGGKLGLSEHGQSEIVAKQPARLRLDFVLQRGVLDRGGGANNEFFAFCCPHALLELSDGGFEQGVRETLAPFGLPT